METPLRQVLADKSTALHFVRPDDTVAEAIRVMNESNVGLVLVFQDGSLAGVFSERDVLRRVAAENRLPESVRIAEVMTREVITVPPGCRVDEALQICTNHRVRHLPVMSGDDLHGVVSIGDLVRWVIKDQEEAITELRRYIYGGQV